MKENAAVRGEYVVVAVADGGKAWNFDGGSDNHLLVQRVMQIVMFVVSFTVVGMCLHNYASSLGFISHYFVVDRGVKWMSWVSLDMDFNGLVKANTLTH